MAKSGGSVTQYRTPSGDTVTNDEIERLADEAEAGYDLEQAERQHLGRPSLGRGVSPRVSFRMGLALYQAAHQRAAREGRSVSDIAREAMERYLVDGSEP
jgi:hypothetical protein